MFSHAWDRGLYGRYIVVRRDKVARFFLTEDGTLRGRSWYFVILKAVNDSEEDPFVSVRGQLYGHCKRSQSDKRPAKRRNIGRSCRDEIVNSHEPRVCYTIKARIMARWR